MLKIHNKMRQTTVVLRDQNPTHLKLQGKEFVQNLPNENDGQIMKDEKPPIEAPCIELEKANSEKSKKLSFLMLLRVTNRKEQLLVQNI
ncbi:hypothetical protein LOK49_LG06G01705 [Camellia lanceoleosa]|uniref:Uncharacterized protein n=1 Tax=Camellia lanceoleosa TaxID=1840588 RepID=A0ACC0HG47_9ERIC|nr:hypothetical protein LOK49_LG06G01705 [Camellia lanceoleosa]